MSMQKIYDYLERLSNLQRSDARQSLTLYGLQPIQLEALHYLSVCNRYSDTPMAVTEYLGQTKGTVSQTLKILEKKGLLERRADSKDKRISHLRVSPVGEKILQEVVPTPLFIEAGKQLSEASKNQLATAFNEFLRVLQQANSLKTFGVCHSCRHNRKLDEGGYFCNLTEEKLSGKDIELICREHEVGNSN